jgi:Na+/H+ antiporter NhaA
VRKEDGKGPKLIDQLPIDYLGNTMTLKLLEYSFYFLGQIFGVSYSMLQVNILDWYQTSQWKKIIRVIILVGFSYMMSYYNDKLVSLMSS